ncbi:polymerase most proteins contain PALM domain HD hydrolase domain and Zn-ribbon domain [Spirochaeta thermophila DSM 6192]|uniref:Polymerase most proteins contain PALM domain HD hydrolase domain and Zn-ribbon domain n=2 Tax=Winmispira thermophila TaxID=154 RepID=E0RS95_WINT6|nr:FapA family protein [Spirochaeta thermophila]ADN01882.1 polymerase most proteins contain PALM domain HD hydrolase domain and Zn-ribbon domain [Spirochaeta thermophila DSM 6192]
MISLDQLRDYMKTQLEEDKRRKLVQVTGQTLEEALQEAAIELGCRIKDLEYEVIEKGSSGFLGMGKKSWLVVASLAVQKVKEEVREEEAGLGIEEMAPLPKDRDGQAFVRLSPDGVYLCVIPPEGKGKPVTERAALEAIARRTDASVDVNLVSKVVRKADGQFVRIAPYSYNPAHDAVLSVNITDGEMRAYLLAQPPREGGTDPTAEMIRDFLKMNGVEYGLKEDVIEEFERNPRYGQEILIAEGTPPRHGEDAKIVYNFETNPSRIRLKERDGRVDYKDLNLVQNVVAGQVLAKKIPPGKGVPGKTVTGTLLPARDGKDLPIPVGKNVKLSEDGMVAVAEINGQVMITGGKISVEPVYTVEGDVSLKTGNILFLGTVIVKGNVEDGFSVKASGNIEVKGSVGKCELDAEGDIVVHQGIAGKSAALIRAGKNVVSRFIENARVEAGEFVLVSDGIINCTVSANKKIICHGRRASIVGGKLIATEEIVAKNLGSVGGIETILEVGYDPRAKEKEEHLSQELEKLQDELKEIMLNLGTLENQRKTQKLSEERLKVYKELLLRRRELSLKVENLQKEIEDTRAYLSQLKTKGRISASGTVFPGVKIVIRDAVLQVKNEFKAVTFISEANMVKVTKYEEPEDLDKLDLLER